MMVKPEEDYRFASRRTSYSRSPLQKKTNKDKENKNKIKKKKTKKKWLASPLVFLSASPPRRRRAWLKGNLKFKGWNSQAHRELPGEFESSNLGRDLRRKCVYVYIYIYIYTHTHIIHICNKWAYVCLGERVASTDNVYMCNRGICKDFACRVLLILLSLLYNMYVWEIGRSVSPRRRRSNNTNTTNNNNNNNNTNTTNNNNNNNTNTTNNNNNNISNRCTS